MATRGPARPPLAYADPAGRQIKMPGSLPVIFSFCRRLGIAAIIDDAAPIRDVAAVTAGQAVEAMACNRLTSPTPLVHVQGWAATWAAEEIPGIAPASLNDDKPGRTLDAIAPCLEQITSAVAVRAITAFGTGISRLHWDMTSFSLHGACDSADEDYPEPRYGHPKDRRTDLLQVQAGIAAAGDGGIPACHRAYDGGAAEVSQVTGAMTELKKIAGKKTFLLIGDSKLISYDNVAAITGKECTFLAPASKTYVKAAGLAACDLAQAAEVSYIAQRDERKDPGQRGRWHVLEDSQPLTIRNPKRKKDPPIDVRRIFVHSSARAAAAAASRAKKLARARDDLDRLARGLGGRFYPGEQAVTARLQQITVSRKAGPYLRYTVTTTPAAGTAGEAAMAGMAGTGSGGPGKPALAWWLDQDAIDAEAATDGWYALLTNLDASITAAEVLLRYKGQEAVERRYGNLKGPLAVAPMFLNSNRRIAALITVISLALLIFCLIEREARRNLAPETRVDGLYNRQPARPAGRLILTALAGLQLIPATATSPAQIIRPSPVQARLLDLLGVDPTRPP
ncbi:MAG TPA: IS1634 family transposase [Streptosporangiaceae bacterium]